MVRKKVLAGFVLFMGAMWVCTLVSKSLYATRLPVVNTVMPEEKYIEHIVEVEGIVVEGGKQAVSALSGLRVKDLLVHAGDQVEEGDVLFTIDLEDLKEIMGEKQSAIDEIQLQANAILENKALAQQRKEIEEARAREDYDTTARQKDTDVGRAMDQYVRALEELESAEGADEEEQQRLRDELQSAAYAEADAMRERDAAVKEAGRSVEDILMPDNADATLSVYQSQMADLREGLAVYQEVLNAQGNVTAKSQGMITDIYVQEGGRVPDAAAMMMTDESVPCQFKVTIDQTQKKYVGYGDEVLVELDGSGGELKVKVDYLTESQLMPGGYEILFDLPQDIGFPGLSGVMKRTERGEKYYCCVPSGAVYESQQKRNFVYVVKEREGILGPEYYVEEVTVRVLDSNESWAALEAPALDSKSKVITYADKELGKGDVVRWVE